MACVFLQYEDSKVMSGHKHSSIRIRMGDEKQAAAVVTEARLEVFEEKKKFESRHILSLVREAPFL